MPQYLYDRTRIWRKVHEAMILSCLVGGSMLLEMLLLPTLRPLISIKDILNAATYLGIVVDHALNL